MGGYRATVGVAIDTDTIDRHRAAQTAARSWRGGMIDLIEQWNNNTHIGVCVLSVFLLSVFMLYLYMWGENGGGNRGEIRGAPLNHAARRFF